MLGNNRKISVSFVSEALPTTSNDPFMSRRNPAVKNIQQKILRLQVTQIVLGLTLMILSAMAIIEERVFFGLGFAIISALLTIICSVVGTQQTNPKLLFLVNTVGLCGLIPAFNYTILSLNDNILHRMEMRNSSTPTTLDSLYNSVPNDGGRNISSSTGILYMNPSHHQEDQRRFTTTSWILGWAELLHLIPLASSFLYSSYLLKDINCYQLAASN